MKKLNYFLTLLVSVLALSACTNEVDNYFSESSSERSAKDIERVKNILMSAPNGWRMEYYGSLSYGGYNVLCKFDKDHVSFASEKVGKTHKAGLDENGKLIGVDQKSSYTVMQSMGTVLSFDGYNDVFHYFSEPKNSDYGQAGDGFAGDFEFRVLSATPEKIELKGRKHGTKILMYPMPADLDWADYIKDVMATEKYMSSRSYTLMGEGVPETSEILVRQQYRTLVFQYLDENKEARLVSVPFIVTPAGFILYAPAEINGIKIGNVAKGDTYERFYFVDNKNLWLETAMPPLWETLKDGMWFVAYSKVGQYQMPLWDAFKEALKTAGMNKKEVTLYNVLIGRYENKVGFHFFTSEDKGIVGFEFSNPNEEGNEITIKYTDEKPTNKFAKDYMKKHKLKPIIESFAGIGSKARRFKLESDNDRKPTYIKLTDLNEPTNIITLTADQVNYPFDH
ncbi:MAG: DUF4302 domain-containing protein [Prevotella sp.]|uniref:DUF4302 domain-containing protein n=1 Tax=Prevotella sp. TaxID=59823 RepID=UPI002A2ECB47|nr:DUF4302 domain-containing protein [Prevotella sp.]MDD7318581.1 DUF4302 domain-containing protein [Prevotellaceae bacterium]MDY4020382.1 DUF4302 domain-containing protein [Prevotella sp.]